MAQIISGKLLVPEVAVETSFKSILKNSTIEGLVSLMNTENVDKSSVMKFAYDSIDKSYSVIINL